MITFTHADFSWFLLWFSALWLLVAAGACWTTRTIVLDHAAEAEFASEERKAGGRHRITPDDSGRDDWTTGQPDTIPLGRLRVNFATGPADLGPFVKQPAAGRELMSTRPGGYLTPEALQSAIELTRVKAGSTTDWIRALHDDTTQFIAAMGADQ